MQVDGTAVTGLSMSARGAVRMAGQTRWSVAAGRDSHEPPVVAGGGMWWRKGEREREGDGICGRAAVD